MRHIVFLLTFVTFTGDKSADNLVVVYCVIGKRNFASMEL
jgi:hypothetical protein